MPNPNPDNQKEPEDIFSPVDPRKITEIPKRQAPREIPSQEPILPSPAPKAKRILGIILMIIIVAILAGAGIFVFGSDYFKKNKNKDENVPFIENKVENINTPVVVNTDVNVVLVNQVKDTDGDGLSDDEEKDLGTDHNKTDSDNDGLFDREEVKVYKTDPKDPDTDGDGMVDGQEVKQGYNPNGQGKLIDLVNK